MKTYDSGQVAAILQVQPLTVRKLARSGKLPGFKIGKDWRFTDADIQQFMDRQRPTRKAETTA